MQRTAHCSSRGSDFTFHWSHYDQLFTPARLLGRALERQLKDEDCPENMQCMQELERQNKDKKDGKEKLWWP